MISFPFDSEVTYEADGTPVYDRGSDSSILSQFFGLMFSDGVFATPEDGLLVTTSTNDMSVTVRPGNCMIQGHMAIEAYERTLVFEASGTANDRIDAVVARLNINHDYRDIDLYVIKGTEDASPVPPALTRVGGIYEIRLANVYIPKNTSIITTDRITDTRKIEDECGTVSTTPDAYLYYKKAEIEAFLKEKQDASTAITTGNIGNQSVKYATSAGNADTVDGHHFNWSGQNGQPKWLWGGNDTNNMYVYNPSNFSVNYAKSSGNADTVDGKHSSDFQAASDVLDSVNANWDTVQTKANNAFPKSGGTINGTVNLNNNGIYDSHTLQSRSTLFLRTTDKVSVENHAGNANMDIRCSYLHCVDVVKDSYRGAKENILSVSDEMAKKILDVPVRKFDYRAGFGGNKKNVLGMIVDEVQDIIPESVIIPENWNEDNFNELLGDMGNENIPCIDYTTFIPYLVDMIQIQQKEIDELKQKVTALENK